MDRSDGDSAGYRAPPDGDGPSPDLLRELDIERARSRRLERKIIHLRRENRQLEDQLQDVYRSETFRLGRILLRFPRWVKKRLGSEQGRERPPEPDRAPRPVEAVPRKGPVARYALESDDAVRRDYVRLAGEVRSHGPSTGPRVALGVSTADLDAGRGDLFAAIGLARNLERRGFGVIILPPERWDETPPGTDLFLALVAEPELALDPLVLPEGCRAVAWVRNSTERWRSLPTLPLYDAVLCSSLRSAEFMRRGFAGQVEILRLAVDHELFAGSGGERFGVVSTLNQWHHDKPRDIYRLLAQVDLEVPLAIFGVQRGLASELEPYRRGRLSFFQLPSLYGQAAYVLDDQQPVNRRFGNLNSRIYESLACGALPVTAAAAGLAEAGLGAVPVVEDPDDIPRTVDAVEERRDELAGRLRDVVLSRHTYERRAAEFEAFVEGISDRVDDPVTVLGFQPDYRATNPYQSLLYSTLQERDRTAVVPVDEPGVFAQAVRRTGGRPVLHVHWTAPVLGPATSRREATERCERYVESLDALRGGSGRLIWTVHNELPHECRFPDVEVELRRELAQRADAIHVMCPATPDIVARVGYQLPAERVTVIPHGSYVDVYPNLVGQDDARAELGLGDADLVYLFLGQIRPYKGLDALLDAFDDVRRDERDSRLVVAGDPRNFPGATELERRASRQPGVLPVFREIADVDLQVFLNAADVFVLPHRRVLNTGGIPLAFSFGLPVVAPATGCVPGQVPDGLGLLFGKERGLDEAMLRARSLVGPGTSRAAFEHAASYTYRDMAEDFWTLLESSRDGGGDVAPGREAPQVR